MNQPADPWDRIEALFDAALEQPRSARVEWVRSASGGDSSLAAEVLAMLAAHDSREGVLDRPLPFVPQSATSASLADAVADRYQLEQLIGEGGMATVHQARQLDSDARVIIKVLKPKIARWFGADRFRTEVELATRLRHPCILGLIDSGERAGYLYYVMPYVGGETLRTRLDQRGRLPAAEAVPLLRGLASALAFAHQAGVVHRDLKPENVLCVGDHAYLMDFGIARLASTLGSRTRAGTVLGTPGYMAPEQEDGRSVDHRADLWAWGVVARETLTGSRGGDLTRRELPPGVKELIDRCLTRDPAARPGSAGELIEVLGPGVTSPPLS